jgi:uncharacterized repeat protein (TIGR01451 family)
MNSAYTLQRGIARGIKQVFFGFLAILFACLFPSVASAQAAFNYVNTTDGAISDFVAAGCANQLVRTFNVTDTFTVGDLNVGLLMSHAWRGDLSISLQAPAAAGGATVALVNRHGGSADNINMLLDDTNANVITNHTADDTAAAGTIAPPWEETIYRPNAPLSAFNGIAANGTWTMRICDNAGGDVGTFFQANLNFTSQSTTVTDVSLSATVLGSTPPAATATGTVTYRLTATNAASATLGATGVNVGAAFPTSLYYQSDTGSGAYASATGIWTVGSLTPGQSKTIDVTFLVMAQSGTVTSTAQVTAQGQTDLDSTPNNGVTTEDDFASVNFVPTARPPSGAPAIACPVGSALFDWGVNTWTVGSLSNTYNLAGVGNFSINMTSTTAYVAGSPAINGNLTGGVGGEVSLYQNLNNNALADTATTVITMPGGLPGMQFKIFDVDYFPNQFADRVTVTGSYQGSPVIPMLTGGTSHYVSGNTAIGDAAALDTTAAGTLTVIFNAPVDTVTVVYGNHTTAPANPGNQWIGLSDLTFCTPYTNVSVTKISQVLSDGVNVSNPKAIPGATVQYCITFGNTGTAALNSVSATDPLPATVTFVPGSMRSGATCGTAATVEDDNNTGGDETDPYGMFITGATVTGTAATMAGGATFAMTFNVTVN